MNDVLDTTLREDVWTMSTYLRKASPEVLYASTGLQLAASQLVYLFEKLETLPLLSETSQDKVFAEIRQHANDGLTLFLKDHDCAVESPIFRPMVEKHLRFFTLMLNEHPKSQGLKGLLNLMTEETPDIIHHLMNNYRRLLYMNLV